MSRYTYTVEITVVAPTEGKAYKALVETVLDENAADEVIIHEDPRVEEDA